MLKLYRLLKLKIGVNELLTPLCLKAHVSEEILNSLSHSLSADLCIHFYWLSRLRQASHRIMIQNSALRLRLGLKLFKISSDTPAFRCHYDAVFTQCSNTE
jgi:hypothetical protein